MSGKNSRLQLPRSGLPPASSLRPAAPKTLYWQRPAEEDIPQIDPHAGIDHLHWGVLAFVELTNDGMTFSDAVNLEVEASTEQEAVARAMNIINRPNYRISFVREACSLDPTVRKLAALAPPAGEAEDDAEDEE